MNKTRRGASIIWAIIISGVLLIVTTTMATFIIKESQMGVRMDDSARAYAAAESGLTWAKDCILGTDCLSNGSVTDGAGGIIKQNFNLKNPDNNNLTTYTVWATFASPTYTIHSLGTSDGVNREIEYDLTPQVRGVFGDTSSDPSVTNGPFTVQDDYSLSFMYWGASNGSALSSTKVGLYDGSNFVGVNLSGYGSIDLTATADNGHSWDSYKAATSPATLLIDTSKYFAQTEGLKVELDYSNGRSLKLTVSGYDTTVGKYVCIGTRTWMLVSPSYKLTSGATAIKYQNSGDPAWYNLVGGNLASFTDSGLSDNTEWIYKASAGTNHDYFSNFYGNGITPVAYTGLNLIAPTGGTYTAADGSALQTSYAPGTNLSIKANPTPGYSFSTWTHCPNVSSSDPTICNVTVGSDTINDSTVAATFTSNWTAVTGGGTFTKIYNADIPSLTWGPAPQDCTTANTTGYGHDCTANGSYKVLLTGTSSKFSSYPAQQACLSVGGRLPTPDELVSIYTNRATYGVLGSSARWSNAQATINNAYYVRFGDGSINSVSKGNSYSVRCVQ